MAVPRHNKSPAAYSGRRSKAKRGLPAGQRMAAIARHAGAVIATAIVSAVAVIGWWTAVIAIGFIGPAAIIGRTAVIVAAILGRSDGEPGADDTGKRRGSGR